MEVNKEKEMRKTKKIAKVLTKIYRTMIFVVVLLFSVCMMFPAKDQLGMMSLLIVIIAFYPIIFGGIIVIVSWIIYGLDLLILKVKNIINKSDKDLP